MPRPQQQGKQQAQQQQAQQSGKGGRRNRGGNGNVAGPYVPAVAMIDDGTFYKGPKMTFVRSSGTEVLDDEEEDGEEEEEEEEEASAQATGAAASSHDDDGAGAELAPVVSSLFASAAVAPLAPTVTSLFASAAAAPPPPRHRGKPSPRRLPHSLRRPRPQGGGGRPLRPSPLPNATAFASLPRMAAPPIKAKKM